MRTMPRLIALITLLVVCVSAQAAIWAHLKAASNSEPVSLEAPLSGIPTKLGEWEGTDRPIEDENLLYADEHFQRVYINRRTGQALSVWMAFSTTGEDRGHHPEVCMMVAGQPEDESAREVLDVPGHEAPVQEYRFGRSGSYQRVFYWHYTLNDQSAEMTRAQQLYHRLHHRPSSMTLEVFAPEISEESAESAREFVRLIDAAVQPIVGPNAERGSERSPVAYVADT